MRTSFSAASTSSGRSTPRPPSRRSTPPRRSLKLSNISDPCLAAPRRMKGDRPRARRGEAMPRPGGPPGRPYERGRLPPLAMPATPRRDEMKGDPECPEARASPGRLSPSSRDRPALHPGPKGGAEGAPDVPDERGVLEGGACPPLHFSLQRTASAPPTISLSSV